MVLGNTGANSSIEILDNPYLKALLDQQKQMIDTYNILIRMQEKLIEIIGSPIFIPKES